MKRYWVFVGMDYEASGGVGDLEGCFETIEEAENCVVEWGKEHSNDYLRKQKYTCLWYQIVDVCDGTIVRHCNNNAFDFLVVLQQDEWNKEGCLLQVKHNGTL